jgi:AraC-like DNA-binding protein
MAELLTAQFSTRNIDSSIARRKSEIFEDFKKSPFIGKVFTSEKISHNTVAEYIRSETGNDFLQYLQWLQLEDEPNLMTLSSTHHYYYEMNDLKNIKILINLKPLNSIKQLESFLQILVRLMPHESSFIGYFKNTDQNKSVFSLPQFSNFFQGFINYIDLKTDNSLTKREVSRLLEKHKLNVVDITEINGMTYFCSQAT